MPPASPGVPLYDLDSSARRFLQHLTEQAAESGAEEAVTRILRICSLDENETDLSAYYFALSLVAAHAREADFLGDPLFFLKLGRRYDILDLGMLGLAMLCARNLRQSIDISLSHSTRNLWHPLSVTRRITQGEASLRLEHSNLTASQLRGFHEEWLSGTWHWLCQRQPELEGCDTMEITLPYPAPAHAADYARFFPGRIVFGAEAGGLSIPRHFYERQFSHELAVPSHLYSSEWYRLIGGRMNTPPLLKDLQILIARNMGAVPVTLEDAARYLRVPIHTLQRMLRRAGITFRDLKLGVNMTLAQRFLTETAIPFKEIAALLGYGHASTFHRAFAQHGGQTPARYRAEAG